MAYNDPRWLTARYPGECRGCGRTIEKGERAFYYPSTKTLLGGAPGCECGDKAAADFEAHAADEAQYHA